MFIGFEFDYFLICPSLSSELDFFLPHYCPWPFSLLIVVLVLTVINEDQNLLVDFIL